MPVFYTPFGRKYTLFENRTEEGRGGEESRVPGWGGNGENVSRLRTRLSRYKRKEKKKEVTMERDSKGSVEREGGGKRTDKG